MLLLVVITSACAATKPPPSRVRALEGGSRFVEVPRAAMRR
jgi:hypothetical protein